MPNQGKNNPEEERLSELVNFVVTPTMLARMKLAAKKAGVPRSYIIRWGLDLILKEYEV
jgi:hypothetical protein